MSQHSPKPITEGYVGDGNPLGPDPLSTPENVEPPKRLCEWWRWDGCKTDTDMCQWPNCPTQPENVEEPT